MKNRTVKLPCFIFLFICVLALSSCSLPKDTLVDRQLLSSCPSEKVTEFEFVRDKMEGLLVSNPKNKDIGYPKAFYDGWKNYYWIPVNGTKVAACGRLNRFSIYDGQEGVLTGGNDSHEDEYDWNLSIVPSADFSFIVTDVFNRTGSTEEWVTEKVDGKPFTAFQAEITPDESLYNNEWFPNIGHENSSYDVPNPVVGVYGPWVMDNNHNNRPEIHPCEAIWWRKRMEKKDEYFIFGIQDDSNRYDRTSGFVFDNDFGVGWKPWAVPPIIGEYRIPFEYTGQFTDHLVVNIEELRAHNVVTPTLQNSRDSDDGNNHILKFKGSIPRVESAISPSNILVEVNETLSLGTNVGVSFVEVCKKPNGNIIGYVQLFTAFGKNINGGEGYHILKVSLDYPKNKVPDVLER